VRPDVGGLGVPLKALAGSLVTPSPWGVAGRRSSFMGGASSPLSAALLEGLNGGRERSPLGTPFAGHVADGDDRRRRWGSFPPCLGSRRWRPWCRRRSLPSGRERGGSLKLAVQSRP